jgi:hypothetical protein
MDKANCGSFYYNYLQFRVGPGLPLLAGCRSHLSFFGDGTSWKARVLQTRSGSTGP